MERLKLKRLCLMLDCSRNAVMSIRQLKEWIDISKKMGYTSVMLYTEDTYEIDGHPYFGYGRGRYSKEELKELDAYALTQGIELIPYIQTLAHIEQIFRWPDYAPLNDIDDILLTEDERVYELIDAMLATMAECFTTRIINVGMDEAKNIGRGAYYDKHGERDHTELLLNHLGRVAKIAEKHGFEICMWSDMFFNLATGATNYFKPNAEVDESVGAIIPENANLIYWDYYKRPVEDYVGMMRVHEKLKRGYWYAGGVWTWDGFSTQNAYSIEALKNNLEGCRICGVENVIITTWGDGGGECSVFEALPSLLFAAEYARGNNDTASIKERFLELFGISFDSFMLFDQVTRDEKERFYLSPSKYLLYNDPFLGFLDSTIPNGCTEEFDRLATLTKPLIKDERWGYLFRTNYTLCTAVAKKCDIGIKIRKAYKEKDNASLGHYAKELMIIKDLVEDFYHAFRIQWMKENKPQGFEVSDIRLGGLMRRLTHCAQRLEEYERGEVDRIDELEDELLDVRGTRENMIQEPAYIRYNQWNRIVSAGIISNSR